VSSPEPSTPTASPHVQSLNLARVQPNPYKGLRITGIEKIGTPGPVEVRAPGPKKGGLGSGLVGDEIGDRRHHGGDDQAVYAYAREDLDAWQDRLGRELASGSFGENLTTLGLDVNDARIGERWRIGETLELQVTDPRIPCATFRGWIAERGWLKTFTAAAVPGAYLRVVTPGPALSGDPITVTHRPDHDVTVALVFRAITNQPELLPRLLAANDLPAGTREMAEQGKTFSLG
jgi:MOSC domain-containing protein YiiM